MGFLGLIYPNDIITPLINHQTALSGVEQCTDCFTIQGTAHITGLFT